jgi:uncharacterized membrane protein
MTSSPPSRGLISKVALTVLVIAGLATACRSTEPTSSPAPLAAHVFDCDNETRFVLVRVDASAQAGDAVDLMLPHRRVRLPRVVAASGVHYAAAGVSVWNKGRETTLEIDGRVSRCVENRPRSLAEDARARSVELRATGNEPGWVFEFFADRLVFIEGYGAQRITLPCSPTQSGSTPAEAVYVAAGEGRRLTVRSRPARCIDTMSGDRHALNVEVELDGKTYRGCGDVRYR